MSNSGGAGADLLSQLIHGMTRNMLPQGHNHSAYNPGDAVQSGRIDILASHAIANQLSTAHPIVQAMYQGSRAVIDGALTATIGPVAIEGAMAAIAAPIQRAMMSKKGKKTPASPGAPHARKTAVVKSTKKTSSSGGASRQKEYTKDGIEIVDAEFVDLPGAYGTPGYKK